MTWTKIACDEREALVTSIGRDERGYGPHAKGFGVLASRTDLDGRNGEPQVFTEWGWYVGTERPVLRDIRWPRYEQHSTVPKPDARPCEHYRWDEEVGQ